MLDTEYNEEEVMELFKRESFLEGKAEGLAMGRSEGLTLVVSRAHLNDVKSLMNNMNLTLENALDILGITGDEREAVLNKFKD